MRSWILKGVRLIPRQHRWKLGRALYMDARGDIPNDMATNGELFLQRCAINGCLQNKAQTRQLWVFDIGANRGDWTASLLAQLDAQSLTGVHIVAFEPDPAANAYLRSRFCSDTRVVIEEVCLSSTSGKANFYRAGPALGTNSLHPADRNYGESIAVTTETLDNYCGTKGVRQPAFVKCDTEGHDYDVMLGARRLLREGAISIFQFEYNFRWILARRYLKDVFELVCELPYRIGKIQRQHVILFDEWHFELERFFEGNYVLLHEDVLNSVPTKKAAFDRSNVMRLGRQR